MIASLGSLLKRIRIVFDTIIGFRVRETYKTGRLSKPSPNFIPPPKTVLCIVPCPPHVNHVQTSSVRTMVITFQCQLELRANLQRRNTLAKMWCAVTIHFVPIQGGLTRGVALPTASRRCDHGL